MDTKLVVNCATGERTTIKLTEDEIAAREELNSQLAADQEAFEAEQAALQAAKQAAQEKLAALGLTEAEIAAITSA